jgi:glycosyltransferase involved in cell wall biosynthesis
MRIAQVSPLYESVPPRLYGGTERVVHHLTEELVRQGHEVTLFASGDSRTSAELRAACPRALRLDPTRCDPIARHYLMIEQLAAAESQFDLVHFHTDYLHFPATRRLRAPHVTTLHGRLDIPDLGPIYDEFGEVPVVSISNAQRVPLPQANWVSTIHHGIPAELLPFTPRPEGYFAFVGRISPEKRVDRAIAIATSLGVPIKIAAKVDKADQTYFDDNIVGLLDHPLVEFIGEIGDAEKAAFLGQARALLFPIDWPEPFGLVMIEAMACGTPVVAFGHGSVPEVLESGVTGYIVDTLEDAVVAASRVGGLNRAAVRAVFEERFTAERMARDYVELYCRLADRDTLEVIAPSAESAAA